MSSHRIEDRGISAITGCPDCGGRCGNRVGETDGKPPAYAPILVIGGAMLAMVVGAGAVLGRIVYTSPEFMTRR